MKNSFTMRILPLDVVKFFPRARRLAAPHGRFHVFAEIPVGHKAGIEKDVVFAGNNHVIEIWDKNKYEAGEMGSEDFVALARKILG